jgi:hypothetical protein
MTSHLGELYRGERVLWTGSPRRYPLFERRDIVSIPLGLVFFVGFALVVRRFPYPGGEEMMVWVSWGFIAVGVYWAISPIIARNLYLRRAQYRITTQRVIVDSTIFGRRNVHSVYLKDLPPPLVRHAREPGSPDGTVGTIVFGNSSPRDYVTITRYGIHIENPEQPPVLIEVEDVQRVRDLIVSAQRELSS